MNEKELANKKHEYLIAQLEMLKNEELEKMLFLKNFVKYNFIVTDEYKDYTKRYIQIELQHFGDEFDFRKVKGNHKNSFYRKSTYVKIMENGQVLMQFETDEDVAKKLGLTLKENINE